MDGAQHGSTRLMSVLAGGLEGRDSSVMSSNSQATKRSSGKLNPQTANSSIVILKTKIEEKIKQSE